MQIREASSPVSSYQLTDREFKLFKDLVFEKSGISLHDGKRELVRTRLSSRLREFGLGSYADYYTLIKKDSTGEELVKLLDAISTNLTSFFRENSHFDFLVKTVIPQLVESKRARGESEIRVWSAGCSSGEEPYSLAFTLMDNLETIKTWDVKILATDLSTDVLATASRGVYKEDRVKSIETGVIKKYFQKGSGDNDGFYRVRPEAKRLIHFKRFNLMTTAFPFRGQFDFIFCRNVMIYFDKPTQEVLVGKYYDVLAPGGYLMIGHSESLTGVKHNFKYSQPTIYRKPG